MGTLVSIISSEKVCIKLMSEALTWFKERARKFAPIFGAYHGLVLSSAKLCPGILESPGSALILAVP